MNIKRKKSKIELPIRNKDGFYEILSLLYVADLMIDLNMQDEESLNFIFNESLIANLIDRDQFDEALEDYDLRERIIMHIIVPEIIKRHAKEKSVRGPKGNGIHSFFDDLTTEPYDMFNAEDEYGITTMTLKNHRKLDHRSESGLTVTRIYMIYRLPIE